MPKITFTNLKEDKKKILVDAFLKEFATHTFDDASLTSVVKSLGIAKGSIYQYFDDKLDLFMYLINECTSTKMKYFKDLKREDCSDFWVFFRLLYSEGIKFDLENPLQSHFLHNLVSSLNSPSIKSLYDDLLNQSVAGFEKMIEHEIKLGLFRADLPIKTMGFLLYKSGVAIQEQMQVFGEINPKESIKNNTPVYQGKVDVLLKTVDDYIQLLKRAFDKEL
ncbi:MAG: hypothetical protein COA58_11670 [Bacteroidetes bacterium]|nr:MAG: hypothetical protein COA58_11670 [Bacteroidota bacterium]